MVFSAVSVQMRTMGSVFDESDSEEVESVVDARDAEAVMVVRETVSVVVSEESDSTNGDVGRDCELAVNVGADCDAAEAAPGSGRPLMGLMACAVCCDCGCGRARDSVESARSAMLAVDDSIVLMREDSSRLNFWCR